MMIERNLSVPLAASLCSWTVGNGLFPLLPTYALERGGSVGSAGVLLAAGFTGLAIGSLLTDRLARAAGSRKRAYLGAALLQVPTYLLMGHTAGGWQLIMLLAVAWLCAGVTGTTLQVLVGLGADDASRGRSLSLLTLTGPVGAAIGSWGAGALAVHAGYQAVFHAAGLTILIASGIMALGLPEGRHQVVAAAPASPTSIEGRPRLLAIEAGLLLAVLCTSAALFLGRLGIPVSMRLLAFDAHAITGSTTVASLVTMPLVLMVGGVSDRVGRRRLLAGVYLLISAGMGILAVAQQQWHFYLAATLLALGSAAGGSVLAALAGDLLPPEALARALARMSAASWCAAIVAFALGGALLDVIAPSALYLSAALLAVSAVIPLGWLRPRVPEVRSAERSCSDQPVLARPDAPPSPSGAPPRA